MVDPFTQVTRFISSRLRHSTDLQAIVPVRNILDFTQGDTDPLNFGTSSVDFPALRLIAIGGEINLKSTSSSAKIEQNYDLLLLTNSMKLSDPTETADLYFPCKWAVLKALFPIIGGAAFSSDELDFSILRLDVDGNSETFDDFETNEGIVAWSSVLTLTVELSIPRKTMGE